MQNSIDSVMAGDSPYLPILDTGTELLQRYTNRHKVSLYCVLTSFHFILSRCRSSRDFSSVVGPGVLIPLAKPNKPRGPLTSLRPIVLLNTIRKVFSLVKLARISTVVSEFLGPTSSGFRAARGTSDVVLTQRWLSAKSQRYVWECHALGLDMSKAFDTINRAKLLDVMSSFLGRDEVHMIQHLLYGTTKSVRMCRSTSKAFHTTSGTV